MKTCCYCGTLKNTGRHSRDCPANTRSGQARDKWQFGYDDGLYGINAFLTHSPQYMMGHSRGRAERDNRQQMAR